MAARYRLGCTLFLIVVAVGACWLAYPIDASAQEVAPKVGGDATAQSARQPAPSIGRMPVNQGSMQRKLPADMAQQFSVDLPGRTLKFKATAGAIVVKDKEGRPTAEIATISYQLEGVDAASRPVSFIFNGGPGSASAWTHLIGFGPWRYSIDGLTPSPSASPTLIPNAETWLDFTDLVFIDPAGTGLSQIITNAVSDGAGSNGPASRGQSGERWFFSVEGDVSSVAETIALWLRNNDRLASPKFLIGESYGGIRAPKVVSRLQSQYGVGIGGLVLISPVLDFAQYRGPRHRTSVFVNSLPTIAAAAQDAKGHPVNSRAELAEVEAYSRGEYLADLMSGPRNSIAVDRIVKRVSAYSGLPEHVVRQYGGRLDEFIYIREANRGEGRQASGYDVSVTGADPNPDAYFPNWQDPFSDALAGPVTSAMLSLYAKLGWKTEIPYQLISGEVIRGWQWGNSNNGVESITQLEAALALDPKLRVLVTHGTTDMRTPYFGSALLLEQLPGYADNPSGRVALKLFAGGHMHYSRDRTRQALRNEVKAMIDARLADFQK